MLTLPSIWKSKCNYTMKFGQFREYNLSNFFLKSHTQSVVKELFEEPLKYQKWAYLGVTSLNICMVCFYCLSKNYQIILKLRQWPLAFTTYKTFSKNKKKFGISLPAYWEWESDFKHVSFKVSLLATLFVLIFKWPCRY